MCHSGWLKQSVNFIAAIYFSYSYVFLMFISWNITISLSYNTVPKYYRALMFCTSIKICKTLRNHVCQLSRLACYAFLSIDKSQNASLWWRGKGLTIIVILIPLLRTPWSSSILKNILITVIFGAVRPPPVSMCCSIHLVKIP